MEEDNSQRTVRLLEILAEGCRKHPAYRARRPATGWELLSNLVFEVFWLCGDLAWFCGFNSVFEFDANDDFGEGVKVA